MRKITALEFFRDGARKTKTIEEIERENAKIFGNRKRKKSFDSVRVLRELRG